MKEETTMKRNEFIRSEIETLIRTADPEAIIELYNAYCDEINDPDGRLFRTDELDELLGGMKPTEIINLMDSDFELSRDWCYFDGYGHLHSTDEPILEIDCGISDMAAWLMDHDSDLGSPDLRYWIDDIKIQAESYAAD